MAAGSGGRRAALVTGASYGIGAAIAIGLAEDGFDVAVSDLRTADLADTVARIAATGRAAHAVALDLRDQASLEAGLAAAAEAFPHLDVLVNNAGVPSLRKPAFEVARAEWDPIIAVNLTGTYFMSQAMGRHLIAAGRPGAVISVASTHGVVGFPGSSAYGIAKAGIIQMCKVLALEWAGHGIRVNAIAPAATPTRSRLSASDPAHRARMESRIPMKRLGTPEDMAGAVRYLASPAAAYVTGQTIVVDGGLTAA